ncbi:MAG: hypothetical protein QOH64_1886 [Acidimicrobiaceae bacterium]
MDVLARFKRWPKLAQITAPATVAILVLGVIASASQGSSATRASTVPGAPSASQPVVTTTTERIVTTTTTVRLAPGQSDALHPSSSLTPGDVFPAATADVICVAGYSAGVRDVDASLRSQVFAAYGISSETRSDYQLDHLVPLELGGSNDAKNLWPEPLAASSGNGAHSKDTAENQFHDAVCSGRADLAAAQAGILHWDTVSVASLTAPATTTTEPPVTAAPTTSPPATLPPVTEPPVVAPPETSAPQPDCTPGYDPCIPPGSDVDCAGGSGDGPRYVTGPVTVTGSDPYKLDRDHDGIACES